MKKVLDEQVMEELDKIKDSIDTNLADSKLQPLYSATQQAYDMFQEWTTNLDKQVHLLSGYMSTWGDPIWPAVFALFVSWGVIGLLIFTLGAAIIGVTADRYNKSIDIPRELSTASCWMYILSAIFASISVVAACLYMMLLVPASQGCVLARNEVMRDGNFSIVLQLFKGGNTQQIEDIFNECLTEAGGGNLVKALKQDENFKQAFYTVGNVSEQLDTHIGSMDFDTSSTEQLISAVQGAGWLVTFHTERMVDAAWNPPVASGGLPVTGPDETLAKMSTEVDDKVIECDSGMKTFLPLCKDVDSITLPGLRTLQNRINKRLEDYTLATITTRFCFPFGDLCNGFPAGTPRITGDADPDADNPIRQTFRHMCTRSPTRPCTLRTPETQRNPAEFWLVDVMWGSAKMKLLTSTAYDCNGSPCDKDAFLKYYEKGDAAHGGYLAAMASRVAVQTKDFITDIKPKATAFAEDQVVPELTAVNNSAAAIYENSNCRFFFYNMLIIVDAVCTDAFPAVAMMSLSYIFFFIIGMILMVLFWILHHYLKSFYNPIMRDGPDVMDPDGNRVLLTRIAWQFKRAAKREMIEELESAREEEQAARAALKEQQKDNQWGKGVIPYNVEHMSPGYLEQAGLVGILRPL
eukprot:GHVU01059264.1.p1 GENE.GHVU01059264.1~~GHVU01059264.1.p1  ORF type:complete len:635 (+),score=81.63 GHVU01059264.1:268-2172(+)